MLRFRRQNNWGSHPFMLGPESTVTMGRRTRHRSRESLQPELQLRFFPPAARGRRKCSWHVSTGERQFRVRSASVVRPDEQQRGRRFAICISARSITCTMHRNSKLHLREFPVFRWFQRSLPWHGLGFKRTQGQLDEIPQSC